MPGAHLPFAKPRLVVLVGIVHLGVRDEDGEEAHVGRGSRGCHGDQRRGEGGSFEPTEPGGYINRSACQLAILDSLSAQLPQEVGRSLRTRGSGTRRSRTHPTCFGLQRRSAACFPRAIRVTV